MARSRTGEQGPNRMNSLAVATNDAADIALSKLQLEDGCSAARNFREHAGVPVVRAMPNAPSQVGEGIAGICAGAHARPEHLKVAEDVLAAKLAVPP